MNEVTENSRIWNHLIEKEVDEYVENGRESEFAKNHFKRKPYSTAERIKNAE